MQQDNVKKGERGFTIFSPGCSGKGQPAYFQAVQRMSSFESLLLCRKRHLLFDILHMILVFYIKLFGVSG